MYLRKLALLVIKNREKRVWEIYTYDVERDEPYKMFQRSLRLSEMQVESSVINYLERQGHYISYKPVKRKQWWKQFQGGGL